MSVNFDPSITGPKEAQWHPTNQWKPRSLTSAARAQFLTTKMEPAPQTSNRRMVVVDASYVATQLAKQGGNRGPAMAQIPNPHVQHNGKASQAHPPRAIPSKNQQEHGGTGLDQPQHFKAESSTRGVQDKDGPSKLGIKPDFKTAVPKLGYAKIGFDERDSHQKKFLTPGGRKMSTDKMGCHDQNECRTGAQDKTTGQGLKEQKTGQDKAGQDQTGQGKAENKLEGGTPVGSHSRTARPVQKETLQPSVLMLGHSGAAPERLRVTTPRCRSADPTSSHSTPRITRSTGSPYLEDQQISISSHHHHHHNHHPHPHPHHHHHHHPTHHPPNQRYHPHYHHHHHHHHAGKDRKQSAGGGSAVKVGSASLRRHSSPEYRALSGRCQNSGHRIGRCPTGAPAAPFYKAALALMQAQRLRGSVVRISPSPSSSSSSSSSPVTSPRNSVFYLPPPPPPPPLLYHPPPGQRVFLAQHNPHGDYSNRGPPKSILRPPPSPVQRRSKADWNSGPATSLSHPALSRSTRPPVSPPPPPSDSLRVTPRKKVTFGNDVIVHLRHHDVGATGRVLSSKV